MELDMYQACRECVQKFVNLLLFSGKVMKQRYFGSVFFLGTSSPVETMVALYGKRCDLESFDIALMKQVLRSQGFKMVRCIRHSPHIWQGWFVP